MEIRDLFFEIDRMATAAKKNEPYVGNVSFSDFMDLVKKTPNKKVEIEMMPNGDIRVKADNFEIGTF